MFVGSACVNGVRERVIVPRAIVAFIQVSTIPFLLHPILEQDMRMRTIRRYSKSI